MQESSAQPKQTFSSSSLLETNKNRASRTAIAKSLGKKKNKTKSRSSAETSATGDLPTDLLKRQRQQKRLSLEWIRSQATKLATRKHPKRLAVLAVSVRARREKERESLRYFEWLAEILTQTIFSCLLGSLVMLVCMCM